MSASAVARRGLAPGLLSRTFTLLQLREALENTLSAKNVYVDVDSAGFLVCAGVEDGEARVAAAGVARCAVVGATPAGCVELCEGGTLRVRVRRGVPPHHELTLTMDPTLLAAMQPTCLLPYLTITSSESRDQEIRRLEELEAAARAQCSAEAAERLESAAAAWGRRGSGAHACLYCGKFYSRKYGLKIHIRTHTGHRPLRCPHCARPFADPSNLNKHVRLHRARAHLEAK